MCYYCEHGLPAPVKEVFDALERVDPELESGPGHIVFSDNNLDDNSIRFCLNQCDTDSGLTPEVLDATREALNKLLAIPIEVREPPGVAEWDRANMSSFTKGSK